LEVGEVSPLLPLLAPLAPANIIGVPADAVNGRIGTDGANGIADVVVDAKGPAAGQTMRGTVVVG
jgi:hypothetical protein